MPARLILNADDFGLTFGINRAVAELHRAGVLTSATLIATGPAFQDAVRVAKSLPTLGVGCHILLVDGVPVSPPSEIPTLTPNGRTLRPTLGAFVRDLLLDHINPVEIIREALAQVQNLQRAGIDVTHVDTHKHTHIFPQVLRPLLSLANHTSVTAIRNPFEPSFAAPALNLTRRLQLKLLNHFQPSFNRRTANTLTTNGTLGIAATGILTTETFRDLFAALPDQGTYELCCHPGYNDADLALQNTRLRASREIELQALLTEIPEILASAHPPELIHYGNLKQAAERIP